VNEDRSLELSGETLARLIDAAKERILRHIESLPRQPSADTEGGIALARSLVEPLPREGRPYEELLDLLFDTVIPKSFNTAGPGYLAYIPGGGLPHSAVADLIADATNRYVGVFAAAPGLAQVEANVVRWFCEIVGYPATAGGILTSGGSLSNFSALVTARRERLPEDFLSGMIYVSDQTHHSIQKAAVLAGFPRATSKRSRRTRRSGFGSESSGARSPTTAPRARPRLPRWPMPEPPTREPSTISRRWRRSPRRSASGSMWTAPTEDSSS